jgi:phosphomannomutase/phosphoglucomutase
MKKGNCDIGIAFDGDGDRLIVIDGSFNIIWPDQLMMVYSKTLLSKKIGKVVFDVKCSDNLEKIILDMGGTPIRSRTGHSYIKKSLIKNNALLAGEMSGHIFFNDGWYGFDDGIFAAITLLEIVSKEKNPKKAFDWLPASFSTPEINIEFRENEHFDFFKLFVKLNSFEDAVIDDLDGLRIIYPNGWALIRCSNTSSNIVLRFEANDEKMLNNIKNIIRDAILKVNSSITIPF